MGCPLEQVGAQYLSFVVATFLGGWKRKRLKSNKKGGKKKKGRRLRPWMGLKGAAPMLLCCVKIFGYSFFKLYFYSIK